MMNCCHCEKCIRTIIALAVAGVDPAQCGFTIDPETIRAMREQFVSRRLKNAYLALWYQPMQQEIPDEIEGDCFGLREFLEWFRDFDLLKGDDLKPSPFSIGSIYSRCPYPLALAIRSTVFGILGEPHWMNRVESLPPDDGVESSHE